MVTYTDRPWTKLYDAGCPATLEYPDIPLHQFLSDSAKKFPANPAIITSLHLPLFGRRASTITYKDLDSLSDALAAGLVDLGLKKGDRVALVMPNCTAFVISFYAILKAGGVVAATNPTYPPDKLQYQLNDCDAEIVLTLTLFYNAVKQAQPQTKIKTVIATNVKEYFPGLGKFLFTLAREKKDGHRIEQLGAGDVWLQDVLTRHAGQRANVDVNGDDLALFQYTGGTTGVSKAAMATHRGLVANVMQMHAFLGEDIPPQNEIFIGALPLFHVFGMVAILSLGIKMGARIALVINARDIDDLLDTIHTFQPTLFHGVPALYNAINNHPAVREGKINLKTIRAAISGSAPLPPATKREFERLSGASLREGFGMSEAPTGTHFNPLKGENRTGSIGIPLPDVDCLIVDSDDGQAIIDVGDVGELIISAPNVMKGYHGMPTETSNVLRERDGKIWLHTGDIARMDEDGYFYIVDRKKDMALIGGYNVYPASVEKVLKDHPAVLEVGVAAIPHPEKEGQESLKAWIVFKPDQSATEEELVEHATKHLARYEIPTRFSFVAELPKTDVGKTLRRELVRMEMEEREKSVSS